VKLRHTGTEDSLRLQLYNCTISSHIYFAVYQGRRNDAISHASAMTAIKKQYFYQNLSMLKGYTAQKIAR